MIIQSIWLAIAFPLAGLLFNGLLGRRLGRGVVGIVGPGTVALAFVVGLFAGLDLLALPAQDRAIVVTLWNWISVGSFRAGMSLLADPLSVLMVLVVTGVGFLIHVYSIGYMEHEEDRLYARFFTFLNLFIVSMLILVLADNYLLMYVGWELVGVCSYLLIGFWFRRGDDPQDPVRLKDGELVPVPANLNPADSGKKAFIVNRVGDFGFALGVFLIWTTFGTLNFADVFGAAPEIASGTVTVITLLLFVGAVGKSAQLPLYVWLPDAMAGPTPVSALIHAATMVTAGVYMVARSHALYALAPTTSLVVALVGVITALYAATIALVQTDLKRVLAYSTISQLGYMFLAVGVGAYASGMFHLTTHAFFKALLFLAAGSVMHALGDVIDIRRMGGLRQKMPRTYWTFVIGALALAGFPLTSGFFSKDEILAKAFEFSPILWALGLLTALLTGFYTFRALFVAFWGSARDQELFDHAHESPGVMTWPLILLAGLALFGGILGLPQILGVDHALAGWLHPAFADLEGEGAEAIHHGLSAGLEWGLLGLSSVIALLGIGLAYWFYVANPGWPADLAVRFKSVFKLLVNKYYVDDLYDLLFVDPGKALARFCAQGIDNAAIDGIIDGGARLIVQGGAWLGRLQTGFIRHYALAMFLGVIVVVAYFFLR
ncbi:MAG: NADH-quinone oxidoreductase subunit L [Anaerolineales bacterium]|nr:MAG: NADH-quinone oxidoreductase subunit L [Anaerolineales bacterium]